MKQRPLYLMFRMLGWSVFSCGSDAEIVRPPTDAQAGTVSDKGGT